MVYSCEGVGMQVQAASVPAAIRTLLFVVVVEAAGGGYSFCFFPKSPLFTPLTQTSDGDAERGSKLECPRAAASRRPFSSNASPTRPAWPPGGPSRSVWMTPRKADATVLGLRTLPASVGRHAVPSAPVRRNQAEARACVGLAARYAKAH